ncbi:MAG TPA: sigma-70 family RNA polymerase sigma factor [Candidatus Odoribacter faecigallinarum]|uniref:Sigma-70 family RNA polymerase sigma factor n=1 Tax=Candidatus Odoribacter faecigallinarum TaxID=2838706 RepID=A0A9D1UYT6_9BACT|nr:sigma-70 family RNA polymerase sigma factor [Candidatus Odoribacter faecigallinarum]
MATDNEILRLFKENKAQGLRLLFEAYYRKMVLYAHEYTGSLSQAEDIVQDFFIRLWEEDYLENVKPDALRSYLFISIKNFCYSHLHSKTAQIKKVQLTDIDIPMTCAEAMNSEIVERVNESIAKLPPQTATIVDCILMQDMKYQETANKLNISINTVKTLLKKGIKFLREDLKDDLYLLFYFFYKKNPFPNHPF